MTSANQAMPGLWVRTSPGENLFYTPPSFDYQKTIQLPTLLAQLATFIKVRKIICQRVKSEGEWKENSSRCERRSGYWKSATLGRDPTTALHEDFWLLGLPPGPIRPSLVNLDAADSSTTPILMQGIVRTPDRHERHVSTIPDLQSSAWTSFPVAGLQKCATLPADGNVSKQLFKINNNIHPK